MMLFVVAAALVDPKGRVLVQQRPEGKPLAGLWEFPGGKVETGETPEAALCRELQEELGLEVAPAGLTPLTFATQALGERDLLLLLYGCREWTGHPHACDGQRLDWLAPADMDVSVMPPADRAFPAAIARWLADTSAIG